MYIRLRASEKAGLRDWAFEERRDPRDQAALLVREALEQRGKIGAAPFSAQINEVIPQERTADAAAVPASADRFKPVFAPVEEQTNGD